MIDYANWGAPPRRRRRRPGWGRPVMAGLLVLAVLGGGYVAVRHLLSPPPATAAGTGLSTGTGGITTAAGRLALGGCIDPTTSEVASFPQQIRSDLAQALGGLAQPGQVPTSSGSGSGPVTTPQPAVSLTIRQVDTTSFSSVATRYSAAVTIPGVPGLAQSRPGPASDENQLRAWSAAYQQVTTARIAATAAARRAQQTVSAMPLDQSPSSLSAISACVSALLLTAPADGQHSYLIASDLQENMAPQLAGSFHHAPLLIIQACDSGDAATCQGLLDRFEGEMQRLDVGTITVVRPETAMGAITDWMNTGGSNP